MHPQTLKDKYGDKICFWGGGCNTQEILPFASPEQVRQNVQMLTSVFKKNSGFVFNAVHNIMGNVPLDNIVAMYEQAYKNSFWEE
jgi:uroporphyrinogen decarboxylase